MSICKWLEELILIKTRHPQLTANSITSLLKEVVSLRFELGRAEHHLKWQKRKIDRLQIENFTLLTRT